MPVTQMLQAMADGSVKILVTVPFYPAQQPSAACGTNAPSTRNLLAGISVSTTGGSLLGGHSYFYFFVAVDASGLLSPAGLAIQVDVPAGTNTNQVTLTGIGVFDQFAAKYQVYRAQDDPSVPLQILGSTAMPGGVFTFTDTGLATSNILPPVSGFTATRLYWKLSTDSLWVLAAETSDPTQSMLSFLLPWNINGSQVNLQLRAVDSNNVETPQSMAPTETITLSAVYPTSLQLANSATGGNPVSFTAQGSIPPNLSQSTFSYTSTTSSIVLSWTAGTILRSDGTSQAFTAGSVTITGLAASTTYSFYPYYDEVAGAVAFSAGGGGSTGTAFVGSNAVASQTQNLQSHTPLSNGPVTSATTSSGSGGGGTGGGGTGICVRRGMKVETEERGIVDIETCEVGEHLLTLDVAKHEMAWTQIVARRCARQGLWVRLVTEEGAVQVTPSHEIILNDGKGCPAKHLHLSKVLIGRKRFALINAIELKREEDEKLSLSCEPIHMFFAGENAPDILVHNTRPNS